MAQAALAHQSLHPRDCTKWHREQRRGNGIVFPFGQEEDGRECVVEAEHHIDIGERKLAGHEEEVARGVHERESGDEQLGHRDCPHSERRL